MNLWDTVAGHHAIESFPEIANSLNKIAHELERANDLKKAELLSKGIDVTEKATKE